MLEPIKGLDPGYLLPSFTKSFVHLSVCESANTCPLEFWHLWGSIQGHVVPLFDWPAWAGHQHLNAKKVRLTQKFHKLRNIYFPLVKSTQSLNIKTARPLWFLSLKKIIKRQSLEWFWRKRSQGSDAFNAQLLSLRAMVVSEKGSDAWMQCAPLENLFHQWQGMWGDFTVWPVLLLRYRLNPRIQVLDQKLGCNWPTWYERQGGAGGERKLFILTSFGFLSQTHMSLLLLKSAQTVPGQRLLFPRVPALEMGRGGWYWSLLGAALGLCHKHQ